MFWLASTCRVFALIITQQQLVQLWQKLSPGCFNLSADIFLDPIYLSVNKLHKFWIRKDHLETLHLKNLTSSHCFFGKSVNEKSLKALTRTQHIRQSDLLRQQSFASWKTWRKEACRFLLDKPRHAQESIYNEVKKSHKNFTFAKSANCWTCVLIPWTASCNPLHPRFFPPSIGPGETCSSDFL